MLYSQLSLLAFLNPVAVSGLAMKCGAPFLSGYRCRPGLTSRLIRQFASLLQYCNAIYSRIFAHKYKYVLNSVVKIPLMFVQYFEYCGIILAGGGAFFHSTVIINPGLHR